MLFPTHTAKDFFYNGIVKPKINLAVYWHMSYVILAKEAMVSYKCHFWEEKDIKPLQVKLKIRLPQ